MSFKTEFVHPRLQHLSLCNDLTCAGFTTFPLQSAPPARATETLAAAAAASSSSPTATASTAAEAADAAATAAAAATPMSMITFLHWQQHVAHCDTAATSAAPKLVDLRLLRRLFF